MAAPLPRAGPQEGDEEAAASLRPAPRARSVAPAPPDFSRLLPAPPGPLPAPSGFGSGAAAAGRCGDRRGPIGGVASPLSRGLPEPRPAAARDPAGPARGGEGRWPRACGTRGRPGWGPGGVIFRGFGALSDPGAPRGGAGREDQGFGRLKRGAERQASG